MLKEVLEFLSNNRLRTIEISRYIGTEHFTPITMVKTIYLKKPVTEQEYEELLAGIKDPNVVEEKIYSFEQSNDGKNFIQLVNETENKITADNKPRM